MSTTTLPRLLNRKALAQELGHEGLSVRVVRGIWNPHTGEYHWTSVGLRHIAKASISVVEEAPHGQADAVEQEAAA